MNKQFLFIWLFICLGFSAFGQTRRQQEAANRALIEERIELLNEDQDENGEVDLTALFDAFNSLLEHPLNLNSANEDDLRALFFLSEIQISSIINHRVKYGDFISIYELKQLRFLDNETRYFMLPFITVAEKNSVPKKNILSVFDGGKNELWLRYQRQLQDQNGFSTNNDGETPYKGSPDKFYLRYRYTKGTNFSLGITGEKDAGEEFFSGSNSKGFDFYSGHLFYKNTGFIKRLALGDYHAKFGQGLVTWSGYAFGKSADVTTAKRPTIGIKANTSADENLFLRGGAITFGPEKLDITIFYSRKYIDGNLALTLDSTNQEISEFSSIQNTGLHRTENEIEDKNGVLENHVGVNISTLVNGWKIGLNGIKTSYDLSLNRNLSLYNQFEFSAQENTAYSLDYGKVWKNLNLFGEFARSENGGTALINGLLASLNKQLSLSAVYRNYSRDFHSVLTNGFGETGGTKNEKGLFTGLTYKPNRRIKVTAYADRFKFPWLRFRTDAPSNGIEYLAQFTYKPNRSQEFYVRFRTETKEQNVTGSDALIDFPTEVTKKSLRLNASWKPTAMLQLKSRVEFSQFSESGSQSKNGFLIYQDIIIKPQGKPFQFSMRYALFDMESYDTRIYAYENDLLYVFSVPPYFGKGSRIYVMTKVKIKRRVDLWLRWSQWFYNDRTSISSGNNETEGNIRDEIKIQVRWKF